MLRKVRFQNVKTLHDVSVELSPLTVLVGPNGCGKSTLIDSVELIALLSCPWMHNPLGKAAEDSRLDRIPPDLLRAPDATGPQVWSAEDETGSILSLEVGAPDENSWRPRTRVVASAGEQRIEADLRQSWHDAFLSAREARFNWRVLKLRLLPTGIASPSPVRLEGLEPSGFGLPTLLKDLAGNDHEAFLSIKKDLKEVVPQFEDLRFAKTMSDKGQDLNTLSLMMRGAGRVPAERVSEGTLLALALLAAAHDRSLPRLILMDDLDHGLHLSAQYQIVKAIRRVMELHPDLQIVCTSHSPVLLDGFLPKEVRVMSLDSTGRARIRPLTEAPDYPRWSAILGTGELWANSGEEWVHGEG